MGGAIAGEGRGLLLPATVAGLVHESFRFWLASCKHRFSNCSILSRYFGSVLTFVVVSQTMALQSLVIGKTFATWSEVEEFAAALTRENFFPLAIADSKSIDKYNEKVSKFFIQH